MLQKVFIYNHRLKKADIIYVEVRNMNFDINKVYDMYLYKTDIEERLFESIKACIINKFHFGLPDDHVWTDPEVDIQLGRMIKTPDYLQG